MWEAINNFVQLIPPWYWMIALPLIVIYVLPRIQRDKQGKLYFYSGIIEAKQQSNRQSEYLKQLDKVVQSINKLDVRIGLLEEQSKCTAMENLKQSVSIDDMDISERIYAGLRYRVIYNGNSSTLEKTKKLIEDNPDIYKAVIAVKPELTLKD